jgi:hypothetical protein
VSKEPQTGRPRLRLTRHAAALLLRSLATALLLTAATAVAALLYLMFTTDEIPARAVGLFGSVYVATTGTSAGATDVSLGVANPAALIVLFGLCTLVLVLAHVIYEALQQYRGNLLAARAGSDAA